MLIYASDHGESLGEQGIYLHGLPYRLAPRVQKEVPILLWMSEGYAQREHLNLECLQAHSRAPVSQTFFTTRSWARPKHATARTIPISMCCRCAAATLC